MPRTNPRARASQARDSLAPQHASAVVEPKPLSPAPSRGAKPGSTPAKRASGWTAATADRHVLYTHAVQSVDAEIDFVDETFRRIRGVRASVLREDFCGTAATSCEWVRRRPSNIAIGVDQPTLDWGRPGLGHSPSRSVGRVRLLCRDARSPGRAAAGADAVRR